MVQDRLADRAVQSARSPWRWYEPTTSSEARVAGCAGALPGRPAGAGCAARLIRVRWISSPVQSPA
ncbi:hypothetical protein CA984_17720 [Streptosporangium minutum]|uniref:Uncharacterized protein n=1 Tax=Streptosporangium minutum TaxID=569862 RepID=A0A243RLH1_9ACTN|nr:hypothetical protein CA984_17720 [Streptosporangium minutum]